MRHKIYFRDVENDALFSVTLAFYFLLTLMISHLFFLLYIMLFLFLIGKKKNSQHIIFYGCNYLNLYTHL